MLSLGTVLRNRYRIDRMLEIGALEAQYRGWDLEAGEPVIIKELISQPDLSPAELQDLQQTFAESAASLRALRHPHIVRVLDHFSSPADVSSVVRTGSSEANAYLVLQAVPGQTLAEMIEREGALKESRVNAWSQQILDALAYAHQQGVLHRDIKPANILITPDDRALLTNFEIIALWDPNDPRTWTAKRVMGVPEYAAPERWGMKTSQIDSRSDIYSLGATLYHALTGEQPLTAGERTANPYRFLQVKALAPRVNAKMRGVVLKAMELPPDKRFASAAEMAEAINRRSPAANAQTPQPAPFLPKQGASPWPRIAGLLGSTAVIVAAGLLGLWLNQTVEMPRIDLPLLGVDTAPTESPAASDGLPAAGAPLDATPTASVVASGEARPTDETQPTQTPAPTATPTMPAPVALSPSPPADWKSVITDHFDNNDNQWIVSDYEDDWGTVSRQVTDDTYRWEIDASQAVGRWCTPELANDRGIVGDFYVTVDVQRISGPESAAYGLVLRHTEGSYYLFSVRDDGYYQFSLWTGIAWQPIVDWTQTTGVNSGAVNSLSVIGQGDRFELYINDEFVDTAEDDVLTSGEAGLSISTAATDGLAVFVFDNFELWGPAE